MSENVSFMARNDRPGHQKRRAKTYFFFLLEETDILFSSTSFTWILAAAKEIPVKVDQAGTAVP